jgi:serine phosphatase RsbU (regulator of sigma subunit)/Tfp pilus assembly protein PilF
MRYRFILYFLLYLSPGLILSQQKIVDSLIRMVPPQRDTNRANALIRVSKEVLRSNPDLGKKYLDEAYAISKDFAFEKGEATCLIGYGLVAYYKGELKEAERNYTEAIRLANKINNLKLLGRAYQNMGLVYDDRSDFDKATSYYFMALDIFEKLHDENNAAHALNNIGIVYESQNKLDLSLDYHRRSLAKERIVGDKGGIASSLTNIGLIMKKRGNMDSSMYYYSESLKLREELEDNKGIALVLNNIASIYLAKNKYEEAQTMFRRVLTMSLASNDKYLIALAYNNLGECSCYLKNYKVSLACLDSGWKVASDYGSKDLMMQTCQRYLVVYKSMKDFDKALKYGEQYSELKDSIYNEKNEKAILEMQSRYEADKKERDGKLLSENIALETARVKHDRFYMGSLVTGALLFFVLGGLVYNRAAVKKKANHVLQDQNDLLRAQKEEITDSINYARNIQRSMLPSEEYLTAIMPEYFVLHKPKDIVSGDFYFIEKAENHLIFSAVDCTGHGVPGALLSFLGMDILQDAVHRKGIVQPAGLLHELDSEIRMRLRNSTEHKEIKDGMDLAICSLNTNTLELQVAAAFNPVYIIHQGVLEEIRPDKHAIGTLEKDRDIPFTTHTRQLQKGDCVYVLSDGYADQFGGALGKKFKYKPLKDLLLSNAALPMKDQGNILEQTHIRWKGELFQVDDILIIGIRV